MTSTPSIDVDAYASRSEALSADLIVIVDALGSLGSLLLTLPLRERRSDDDAVAWTDGRAIFFGGRYYSMPLAQRNFVALHELFHVMLDHPRRGKVLMREDPTYDHRLHNVACDVVVNDSLEVFSRHDRGGHVAMPDFAIRGSMVEGWLGHSISGWSSEQIYWALKKIKTRFRSWLAKRSFDPDLPEDVDVVDPAFGPSMSSRLERALREGNHTEAMRRLAGDLPRSTVPWKTALRSFLGRSTRQSPKSDPLRPHPRWCALAPGMRAGGVYLPVIPRVVPGPVPRVAFGIDTSGSIPAEMLATFAAEIAAVVEKTNADALLLVSDMEVHRRVEVHGRREAAKIRGLEFVGFGGTDFKPAIEEAKAWKPTVMVYLTDLLGDAGVPPEFPVLWTVPESLGTVVPPYGSIIRLPI